MEHDFPEDRPQHAPLVRPVPKMDTPTGLIVTYEDGDFLITCI